MKRHFITVFIIIFISLFIPKVYATDLLPIVISHPLPAEWLNIGFKTSFTIANQNILDAQASEWHVVVEIIDDSNNTIYSTTVPGVFLAKRPGGDGTQTTVDMETSDYFAPENPGTYTVSVTVYYLYDINTSNDNLKKTFTVYGFPKKITNPMPSNSAAGVKINSSLSWTNGSNPVTKTDVFFVTSPQMIDFNGTPIFTSMLTDFNSYTPENLLPGTMYYWGISQTNGAGTTTNGPYSFTTGQTLLSTDLTIDNVLSPRKLEYKNTNIYPTFIIKNLGDSTAGKWMLNFSVKDSSGQIVFSGEKADSSLAPDSSKTIMYNMPWLATSAGFYTLESYVQYDNDLDSANNRSTFDFEIINKPMGISILPKQGINFSQLNFEFEDVQQQNSSYGLFSADFEKITEITQKTFGYLNCYSPTLGWFVQNMIFDSSLRLASSYNGLSTLFSLYNLQTPTMKSIESLDVNVFLSDEPITDDFKVTADDLSNYTVTKRPYNTEKELKPVGNIPAPIKFEKIPFKKGGKYDITWQHGHVSIEQDINQCAPCAVANSLQWLENEKVINVPHEHRPGIRDSSLVGQIDLAMKRQPHQALPFKDVHEGKLKYISDNNLSDKLRIKHKNFPGKNYLSNDTVKVGSAVSIPNNDTTITFIDWIIGELKHGEDVELSITWDGGGGHVIDLIGGGYVEGVPWISWVHDANQGYDDNGTPGNTADDKTKLNGGISPDSGGACWSYIINNKLAAVIMGDTSRAYLKYAISESPDSSNTTGVEGSYNYIPENYHLYQNFPNPFNPSTTIRFSIPFRSQVSIVLYDDLGRKVMDVADGIYSAGTHVFNVNLGGFASGVYFYTMQAGKFTNTKKLILLK